MDLNIYHNDKQIKDLLDNDVRLFDVVLFNKRQYVIFPTDKDAVLVTLKAYRRGGFWLLKSIRKCFDNGTFNGIVIRNLTDNGKGDK